VSSNAQFAEIFVPIESNRGQWVWPLALRERWAPQRSPVSYLRFLDALERSMRIYQFRSVKPPNGVVAQSEHECSNDIAAATKARSSCDGYNVEVWEGTRWVATIKEHGKSGAPASGVVP